MAEVSVILGAFLFPFQSSFLQFWGIFNKTISPLQLGATRLVGYLPSHIQQAPVE